MSTMPTDANPASESHRASPRQSSVRSLLLLIVAAAALLAFIVGMGDIRRKHNAIAQMDWHCATYASRMGDTKVLPLNLEPDIADARQAKMLKVFWLPREDARILRGSKERLIAAYTGPVPRALSGNGRAIAYFENGSFTAEWIAVDDFNAQIQKQELTVQGQGSESKDPDTSGN